MTYVVRVESCTKHTDCSVHICVDQNNVEMWSSHAPSSISDEARLNVNGPVAQRGSEVLTWHAFTPEEAKEMGLNTDEHRVLSTLGAVLEHRSVNEVAERSGFSTSDLIAEAEAWAAAESS